MLRNIKNNAVIVGCGGFGREMYEMISRDYNVIGFVDDFVTLYPGAIVAGNVHIGNNCELGTGCNIIQGLDIGKRTIIGAGAVVVRNIPENCTAVGVPAKPIKFREEN